MCPGSHVACQPPSPTSIKVIVTNIAPKKGDVLAALYSSEKGFPGNAAGAYKIARATPVKGTALLEFSQVPGGTYAIALFHDTNNDGKLNTNFLGIPKEGYGVSNNIKNLFSAPGYKQCAFRHQGETRIDIVMRY
ncbi:MAG: DUF2141 domain-containing protein [Chitinophagaceae bacterium]